MIGEHGAEPLEADRTMVAWAHGFVSMEPAGMFRLGGDLDAADATGVDLIIAGINSKSSSKPDDHCVRSGGDPDSLLVEPKVAR